MKVIDNITTPANAAHLKHLLLDEPWYYLKSTAYNAADYKGNIPYETSWVSMIYNNQETMSPLMHLAHSILVKVLHQEKSSQLHTLFSHFRLIHHHLKLNLFFFQYIYLR